MTIDTKDELKIDTEYLENEINNAGTYIGICLLYGLNAIANAIEGQKTETSFDLLDRVNDAYHINKER